MGCLSTNADIIITSPEWLEYVQLFHCMNAAESMHHHSLSHDLWRTKDFVLPPLVFCDMLVPDATKNTQENLHESRHWLR